MTEKFKDTFFSPDSVSVEEYLRKEVLRPSCVLAEMIKAHIEVSKTNWKMLRDCFLIWIGKDEED